MKRMISALVIAVLLATALPFAASASPQSFQVELPAFNVTFNDTPVESLYREFPLFVCKGITYFPMTYYDCRYLGLQTKWDAQTGLDIIKTDRSREYVDYKSNSMNNRTFTATIVEFPVRLNGNPIDNANEEYPLLAFRGVTYFPLTWRFAVDEFGWEYSFSKADGLAIQCIIPVEKVEFESEAITIDLVDGDKLEPIIYPEGATVRSIQYTTNDRNVVTVTNDGVLQAIGVGSAEVTCTIDGVSAHTTVNVEFAQSVPQLSNTQASRISNWAYVSSVQQFAYMDAGIGYAYEQDDSLIISIPGKVIETEMKYPLLGDVIADEDGNIYVVWGRVNATNDTSVETVFISKYSADGAHIMTTGFVGDSKVWGDSGRTKEPFSSGNCVSVIDKGILVNYHGKHRYDGHQSDGVVAVNIHDMSVYNWPNNTYSGHSFNQSVIFCKRTSGFLFASQGDAYARGFRVNGPDGSYGNTNEILFHFYLEANAGYNMSIVNKTFAQLGGLAETSSGVALVGASAESISESAKTEKQNLFVQVFDPLSAEVAPSMFVGGSARSGATSFDINDNANKPLTPVTDYGVRWLTHYTGKDVVAPHSVVADDRIFIFWSTTENESFYIVLSANGDILTPETRLAGMTLNSYEQPVYHNGAIYWISVLNGKLMIRSIDIQKDTH